MSGDDNEEPPRKALSPPIDFLAMKALRERQREAEEIDIGDEAYAEQVGLVHEFFSERIDELISIAFQRFRVHPSDIMDAVYMPVLNCLLDIYRINYEDKERDSFVLDEMLAVIAHRRLHGSRLVTLCTHNKPYPTCKKCVGAALKDDERIAKELEESFEVDDDD